MGDPLPAISIFSGAGGLDMSVERADSKPLSPNEPGHGLMRVAVATDHSESALATLRANMPSTDTLAGDIRNISAADLLRAGGLRKEEPILLVGGPPCTPFSKSGFWIEEKRKSQDPNASLLDDYVRIVKDARPEAFVLENVQGLTYKTHKKQFDKLLSGLGGLGYNPQWKTLLAADYGVPQMRRRVFVVGRRDGSRYKFPTPTHAGPGERRNNPNRSRNLHVSAREAFAGLPSWRQGESPSLVEGRYADLAAAVPAGCNYLWHTERHGGENAFRWRSRYWSFLLRLSPDRPSWTLQAQPGSWVGPFHWENLRNEDGALRARRLSVNEMLRLMTFPDNFLTVGSRTDIQRQVGNAVPMELGKVVVRSLLEQMGYLPSGPKDKVLDI